jgi:hypothetical protein
MPSNDNKIVDAINLARRWSIQNENDLLQVCCHCGEPFVAACTVALSLRRKKSVGWNRFRKILFSVVAVVVANTVWSVWSI